MDVVSKLWGFCNKLRHDGVDSSDYIEQLTYLLFLKIAKEKGIEVPKGYNWQSLLDQDDSSILPHLEVILQKLKSMPGILGDIFSEPVSRVRNAKILRDLVEEIDSIEWSDLNADVVGLTFEELIGKVADEGKKGAGQYFTPRPLIQSIVNVMQPNATETKDFKICDVAAGTAGFLIVAAEWSKKNSHNNKAVKSKTKRSANINYYGQELVQRPRRLALMNLFLHDIKGQIDLTDSIYSVPSELFFDCILTNPPFGNKGSNQIPKRNFPVKTSDKQLNFIQHIIERLKEGGRAAIVLPDSCMSSDAAKRIWSYYLDEKKSGNSVCNLHTILKLPEGVFAAYANGVKACVFFLQKGYSTKKLWIYDARKDIEKITTKSNTLTSEHFQVFEKLYGNDPNGKGSRTKSDRFNYQTIEEIRKREYDLALTEIYNPEQLPHPVLIIDKMISDYEQKIQLLKRLKRSLPNYSNGSTKALAKLITR